MNVKQIINTIDEVCGLKQQEKWDNSGLQVGNLENEISGVLLALDVTKEALNTAKNKGFNLILTHHPLIFGGIDSVDTSSYKGNLIREALINGINIYSLHTALDMADLGVTNTLGKAIGVEKFKILNIVGEKDGKEYGYGGVSEIQDIMLEKFIESIKDNFDCKQLKVFTDNRSKVIKRIAFCGGSGGDFISDAISSGADVYITGDIKYHDAQFAMQNGLSIIDAGHFYTENNVLSLLDSILSEQNIDTFMFTENLVKELYI